MNQAKGEGCGCQVRNDWKGLNIDHHTHSIKQCQLHAQAEQTRRERDQLLEAGKDLVFTSDKLWQEVSPIKSGGAIIVTHPMIENMKIAISLCEQTAREREGKSA